MAANEPRRYGLNDLRAARDTGQPVPVLTCYDYTTAKLLAAAGVQVLLVGDSAANVILGHDSTVPIRLDFLIELTAAVRRGAPGVFLIGDMPFGSYAGPDAADATIRLVQLSGCDCVKLETGPSHLGLVQTLSDNGVAVMAHLGLRPQSVQVLGGYRARGRSPAEAAAIVTLAKRMEQAGASALLLEAIPAEVAEAVVAATHLPVIGCGAGPACHGHVVVTHDLLGLTDRPPRFVPVFAGTQAAIASAAKQYADDVRSRKYPATEHLYTLPADGREGVLDAVRRAASADDLESTQQT